MNDTKVTFNVNGNLGYGANQVEGITLADLRDQLEAAIAEWGEDTEVVLHQANNSFGANYGGFSHELFTEVDADD